MRRKRHEPRPILRAATEWGGRLPVALVFPQKPALAYSSLGWQAVYQRLLRKPSVAVEAVFWDPDQGAILRPGKGRPLDAFGVAAFSLTYEFDYLHVLRVLRAAGIPLAAAQRPSWPLVMAGGALCFLNPAPLAPSVDLFWVGEAEAGVDDCFETLAELYVQGGSREQALEAVAGLPGVLVPGRGAAPVARAVHLSAQTGGGSLPDPAVSCFTSPRAVFRDSLLLEVNRGCPHGCRFCAAGYMYRPHRQASPEMLREAVLRTRPRKVGLVGTALTDWPDLQPFLVWLRNQNIDVSLSSLRAEGLTDALLDTLRSMGIRTVTLALEGASEGLRDSMNKHLRPETFLHAVEQLAVRGFNHLKIYLLTGWPGESERDWQEFASFLRELDAARKVGKTKARDGLQVVTLGLGCLVPKPWTPLQWAAMAAERDLKDRIAFVRKMAKGFAGLRVRCDSPRMARLQGLLARGDEHVHALLSLAAATHGREGEVWAEVLGQWPGDPGWYLDRERGRDEAFPWEAISLGVDREYLWREWENVKARRTSPPCPTLAPREQGRLACAACRRCGLDAWLEKGFARKPDQAAQENPARGEHLPEP